MKSYFESQVNYWEKISPHMKNRYLNELEILNGDFYLHSKPRRMIGRLTGMCNLRCSMCDESNRNRRNEFKWKELENLFTCLPYLQEITWEGGEAFLHPQFADICRECFKHEFLNLNIVTNGLLINEKWADLLVRDKSSLSISIEAFSSDTYEKIRIGGSFDRLKENLRILKGYKEKRNTGFGMCLCCIVMRFNYDQINLIVDFAHEFSFDRILLRKSEGLPSEAAFIDEKIKSGELPDLVMRLERQAREREIFFETNIPKPGEDKEKGEISDRILKCYWPWQSLFINFNGDVKPECTCNTVCGNIKVAPLLDIWNSEKMQEYRKKIFFNEYQDFCNHLCKGKFVTPRLCLK